MIIMTSLTIGMFSLMFNKSEAKNNSREINNFIYNMEV